ncbi:hypothetical protein JCM8547_000424 [Rhodosporidiobolus lusitaniae]
MQSLTRQTAQLARRSAASSVRAVSTQTMSSDEGYAYLNKQRALRPSSPWHVYQPQLTSVSSLANRATGTFLSAAFYGLFLGHLAGPALGVEVDSANILEAYHNLPSWAQFTAKAAIAFPASYHTLNGFRHLGWDMGYFLQLKSSYMAGYVVFGATAVSTVGLLAL